MSGSRSRTVADPPRLAVVGTSGYAFSYLHRARILHDEGLVRFAGMADIRPPSAAAGALLPPGGTAHPSVDDLLRRCRPDITVVATPPHAHVQAGAAVLRAGSDLLLETPPVLDLDGFATLSRLAAETGAACQTGFQSFGSPVLPVLRAAIADGKLGAVAGVGAAGAWIRTDAYYRRNPWAGRRWLDGEAVVDGALTNPFSHAVATALLVGGVAGRDPEEIALELYGTRDIEADDTACLRIRFADGPEIVVAASLCAEQDHEPYVVVHGERARAKFWYKSHRLEIDDERCHLGEPADLLRNLIAHHLDPDGVPLLAPLSGTRAFASVVEAVRDAPSPSRIPAGWIRTVGEGASRHPVVRGIGEEVAVAADRLALFSEIGVPWASAARRRTGGAAAERTG
ncbi:MULTISPECIES: Gfo/Idh/MocA family oxidoreductase [unclassified Amycolatopsis]|uniref:Gfo/Idh/MocA family protein n=1 Tax=unclassified Amycolatopsis TaxID=2618356 RepID=UPI00287403A9|nr:MULTISPECIES: Gfo/Idh/MocA family oxidoreductase [unclassified Amycolatopsis]MDS0139522.1 Gfo/Idh/MocA family oxidoreductase [Amycolatopsis sp. 505]MDS0147101.1 Gfo/Idh/MocA family oxidoreductase [Amycolatopsis sp. CM201R]